MKKGLILGLLLGMGLPGVMAVDLTETPEQEIGYFKDLVTKGTPVYDSRAYASINAAVTAIGATEAVLAVYESETLTASLTIPATCSLYIAQGGMIVQASTYTLTINGSFEAGLYQVFSGFTTVALAKVERILPQWFGATGDGVTDDTTAIQAAIDAAEAAGGTVFFPPGTYLCTVTVGARVSLVGAGAQWTKMEAVNAGEYAVTYDFIGGVPVVVEGIRFRGDGNTKNGLRNMDTTGGGTSALTVRSCYFTVCDKAYYALGHYYWQFYDCLMVQNNYDWFAEGTLTMQAGSALIQQCYSSGAKIACLRMKNALFGLRMRDGIVEDTDGFVAYITGQSTAAMGVLFEGVHLERNCDEASVLVDDVATDTVEFYLSGARVVRLSNMRVKSMYLGASSYVMLDRCQIDVDDWTLTTSGTAANSLIAYHGMPYSLPAVGACLNDVYHASRTLEAAYSWSQVAPGPLTDRLNTTHTNLHTRGSMATDYTPPAVGGNTMTFSSAYDAPIHGRCAVIDFAAADQDRTDGIRIFDNVTITINKWYVWSLDLKSVTDVGYLDAYWRSTLLSTNMKADPDKWTRYWGVCYHSDATGSREQWIWNAHATANPTFLLANVQLVEFDTADEAEKFINEAAYCPDAYMPLVAQQGLRVTGDIVNGDDTMIATKTVYKTIDVDDDASTDDYQFDDDAENTTEQVITLTNILPAYAELVGWQIRCFETVTGSASMQIDFGTTSSGTELGTGSPDTANDILGTEAAASPVLAATNAARSLYISATPGANWNTLDAGRWSLMITYVDYSAVHTQKNP